MEKIKYTLFGYFLPVIAVLILGFGNSGYAQETTGSIEVTVRDAQGAVVPTRR